MNVGATNGYPSSALSNFAGHRFEFRGFQVNSMEGFLQGLKFESPEMQAEVFKLIGKAAKFKGKPKKWYRTQTLYWQGTPIARDSIEYQNLLDEVYEAMYTQSESFRKALVATHGAVLTHSIGKTNKHETVLTRTEFCSRLTKLRDYGTLKGLL